MLTITSHCTDRRRYTVVLNGDLDMQTGPRLSAHIASTLTFQPASVTLDLSGVTFCDAAGITAIVQAHHAAARIGATFSLGHARGQVEHVLDLTGVAAYLSTSHRPDTDHLPDIATALLES